MEFSIKFDTIKFGSFIVFIMGFPDYNFILPLLLLLFFCYVLVNSTSEDPNKISHSVAYIVRVLAVYKSYRLQIVNCQAV